MSSITPEQLKQCLIKGLITAKQAGDIILSFYFNQKVAVQKKKDRSPLTQADLESNRFIIQSLQSFNHSIGIDIPMISEEEVEIPFSTRQHWNLFWIIDPLDGTVEFINRNGEFAVNIALVEQNKPILGIIYIPIRDSFYFGLRGFGSFRISKATSMIDSIATLDFDDRIYEEVIKQAERLPLIKKEDPNAKIVLMVSRSHHSLRAWDFIHYVKKQLNKVEIVTTGSSIKLCIIAEGSADGYPRIGRTMEWDIAPGQIIMEEAGGNIVQWGTLNALEYNKANLANPSFMVLGGFDRLNQFYQQYILKCF